MHVCVRGKKMLNFEEIKKWSFWDSGCCWFVLFIVYNVLFFSLFGFHKETPGLLHWLHHFTRDILAMLLIENPFGIASGENNVNNIHQNINNRHTFLLVYIHCLSLTNCKKHIDLFLLHFARPSISLSLSLSLLY